MKWLKFLALIAAAAAGTVYYQRYHALNSLLGDAPLPVARPGDTASAPPSAGGIGKIGGVGPVGNPGQSSPFTSPDQE